MSQSWRFTCGCCCGDRSLLCWCVCESVCWCVCVWVGSLVLPVPNTLDTDQTHTHSCCCSCDRTARSFYLTCSKESMWVTLRYKNHPKTQPQPFCTIYIVLDFIKDEQLKWVDFFAALRALRCSSVNKEANWEAVFAGWCSGRFPGRSWMEARSTSGWTSQVRRNYKELDGFYCELEIFTSFLCLCLDRQIALMLQKKLHDAFQVWELRVSIVWEPGSFRFKHAKSEII